MALTAGCAIGPSTHAPEPRTRVDYRLVAAPAARRYVVPAGLSASHPLPLDHNAPVYPARMITLHLPRVTVRARVVVDAAGKPSEVRISHPVATATHPAAFDDAVAEAVLHWRYTPLRFSRWQDETDAHGNTAGSHLVSVANKPFSLDYAFDFELRDGKPVVATHSATTVR